MNPLPLCTVKPKIKRSVYAFWRGVCQLSNPRGGEPSPPSADGTSPTLRCAEAGEAGVWNALRGVGTPWGGRTRHSVPRHSDSRRSVPPASPASAQRSVGEVAPQSRRGLSWQARHSGDFSPRFFAAPIRAIVIDLTQYMVYIGNRETK